MGVWYTFSSILSYSQKMRGISVRTRPSGLDFILLFIFLLGTGNVGCSGSGIRTMVHQNPESRVYLEWVQTESFRAAHPADLSPTVIRRSLKGVMIQAPTGIVENLLGKQAKRSRLFSEDDVRLLVPHLVEALSRATPEEHVVFQRMNTMNTQETESVKIAGTLHLQGSLLVLIFTAFDTEVGPNFTLYKGNRDVPDSSGLKDIQFSFIPKAAWRQDLGGDEKVRGPSLTKTLNLDPTMLANLSVDQKASGVGAHEKQGKTEGEGPGSKKDVELKELDEKFKSLRQELSNVENDIERLKQQP